MKRRAPFFKKSHNAWYVELDRKQIRLGTTEEEAFARYHELMAARKKAEKFVNYVEHVQELRLVVTAEDYDAALAFYRDALGMPELAAYQAEGGHVTILDAGRATLEITDPVHAAYIDRVSAGPTFTKRGPASLSQR